MIKDDAVYLGHMHDAIARIQEYTAATDEEGFKGDSMRQDAVIRQLETIGQAAKRVGDETRAQAPQIPWRKLAGMRDKLIHDYFGVDLDAVWMTVTHDLPILEKEIAPLLD